MANFTEKDNVLEVSFDLALNKQAREEVDVYDIVLKHESGSEENTLVDYELSLKESGATLAVKIPKYYFARLGVYSVAVKLSQRDAEALSGRSRIEASQPLCTVISLHRDMESGKTDVELVPFGTATASAGDAEGAAGTTVAFDHSMFNPEQLTPMQMAQLSRRFQFHEIEEDLDFREVVGRIVDNPTEASEMIERVVTSILGEGQTRYVWAPGFTKDDYDTVLAGLDKVKTQEEMFKHILKTLRSIDYMLAQISSEFLKRFYRD